jgi:AraC-like DNA-binding protein
MDLGATSVIGQRRFFESRDEEETRAFLHAKEFELELGRRDAAALDVRLDGINLPEMYVGYVQYGPQITCWTGASRPDYWIQFPIRGNLETIVGREHLAYDPSCAAVVSPSRHTSCRMRAGAGSLRMHVYLNGAGLVDQLEALLGEPADLPLEFEPSMDLTKGYGRSLARYVLMAMSDLDHAESVLWDPGTMRAFARFLMTGLLLSQPNSYSAALQRRTRVIAPRDVKRALEFMDANLERDIALADIVTASGVPGRTLFMHFKDCGIGSPMRYLRNARFRKAREALLRAQAGEGVFEIATGLGFSHMGRFAAEYRRRFGEGPSETLRRR